MSDIVSIEEALLRAAMIEPSYVQMYPAWDAFMDSLYLGKYSAPDLLCPKTDFLCSKQSISNWKCLRPKNHEGDHVAYSFLQKKCMGRWEATSTNDEPVEPEVSLLSGKEKAWDDYLLTLKIGDTVAFNGIPTNSLWCKVISSPQTGKYYCTRPKHHSGDVHISAFTKCTVIWSEYENDWSDLIKAWDDANAVVTKENPYINGYYPFIGSGSYKPYFDAKFVACKVYSPGGDWVCTRPKGHKGSHVACSSTPGDALLVWDAKPDLKTLLSTHEGRVKYALDTPAIAECLKSKKIDAIKKLWDACKAVKVPAGLKESKDVIDEAQEVWLAENINPLVEAFS